MSVSLALLGDLLPSGFSYGKIYLVEFDSSSLWYETSLMMAAQAGKADVKCEYHALQHAPAEIMQSLDALGLDTKELIHESRLRLIDYYTPAAKLGSGEDVPNSESWNARTSLNLKTWSDDTRREILTGPSEADKRWLHIDDNTSVMLQQFKEEALLDFYRTALIPWTRARELLMFTSLVAGIGSEPFYRKFEALADGIIDFSALEEGGELRHYVRLRRAHGESHSSRWRPLSLLEDGRVSFSEFTGDRSVKFKVRHAEHVFDYLVNAFIQDFMVKDLYSESAGWRTLSEIAEGSKMSSSSLYDQYVTSGPVFRELRERGFIEAKRFPGERGRGGEVTRIRVAYGKEHVKTIVNERVRTGAQ